MIDPDDPQGLYAKLGVDADAPPGVIKKAYHRLALRHHPDKGGGTVQFNEINAAYAVLGDPAQRRMYDLTRRGAEQPERSDDKSPFSSSSFFPFEGEEEVDASKTFFDATYGWSGAASGPRRGDVRDADEEAKEKEREREQEEKDAMPVLLSLEEIRAGCERSVRVACILDPCDACDARRICPACGGRGTVVHALGRTLAIRSPCAACSGTGLRNRGRLMCTRCSDVGAVRRKDATVRVAVEPGAIDGSVIRVPGEGSYDPVRRQRRDFLARATYAPNANEFIAPNGSGDVTLKVPILLGEALTGFVGGEKRVSCLGHDLRLLSSKYRDPTEPVILSGYGLPSITAPSRYGDLIIAFEVEWPRSAASDLDRRIQRNVNKYADVIRTMLVMPKDISNPEGGGGGEEKKWTDVELDSFSGISKTK